MNMRVDLFELVCDFINETPNPLGDFGSVKITHDSSYTRHTRPCHAFYNLPAEIKKLR